MAGLDPLNVRLARGEPAAFETVYDLYGPRLHAFLWGWTRDRQAAEDLLQAVMLRLARHRARLRDVGSLRAWLARRTPGEGR